MKSTEEPNNKAFVLKWVEAAEKHESQSWIADQLGLSRQRVSVKASYLRGRGVKLPKLVAHFNQLTPEAVDDLNDLIDKNEAS